MASIVVTGAGGFLGSEIVRQLIDRGDDVIGLSRGRYRSLESLGMRSLRGDLLDDDYIDEAIGTAAADGAGAVIHTAAKAGVWGAYREFHAVNTRATEQIIEACRRHAVSRLVFTSSPSVTFDGDHQRGVDESVGYAQKFRCAYPETKMLGERAVLRADRRAGQTGRTRQARQDAEPADDGPPLRTVAIRPHLIWGGGDPHLLPRILDRARVGKLRIVGDGLNTVDMVHVVNAAAAHLDALDALANDPDRVGGKAYFVSDDTPIKCWQWIAAVCEMHGVPPPSRRISYASARAAGAMLETLYRAMRWTSEPPMTRFVAAQLARDHYFDISAAKADLGYRVRRSPSDGMDQIAAMFARNGGER